VLFVICSIYPNLPNEYVLGIKLSKILVYVCGFWLGIFLIDDLRTILKFKTGIQNSNSHIDQIPAKNLLAICVVGYVVM
jgi:hypothetical protein